MSSFGEMFRESKGAPIMYNGVELVLYDTWDVKDQDEFCFTFESVGSEWRQGVSIGLGKPQSRRKRGEILANGQTLSKPFRVWQDSAPVSFNFVILKPITQLEIYNLWDRGDNLVLYWLSGAAIRIEQIENGRRYFCNDGHFDDKLDDLIFRIERVK